MGRAPGTPLSRSNASTPTTLRAQRRRFASEGSSPRWDSGTWSMRTLWYGPYLVLGASFVSYKLKDPRQQYRLAGLDFDWVGPNVELSGEGVYRTADRPQTSSE